MYAIDSFFVSVLGDKSVCIYQHCSSDTMDTYKAVEHVT